MEYRQCGHAKGLGATTKKSRTDNKCPRTNRGKPWPTLSCPFTETTIQTPFFSGGKGWRRPLARSYDRPPVDTTAVRLGKSGVPHT